MEILIVDDEKDIVEAIAYNLAKEGFKIAKAYDGGTALRLAQEKSPALIILDLMLPVIAGLDACKLLKKDDRTANIPIIMLTAKGTETDRVVGLEIGADDYITKPFNMCELVARVKTVLRRSGSKESYVPKTILFSDIKIDVDQHAVKVNGREVEFTAKEFALLKFLAENKAKVFSRVKLLDTVWGIDAEIETRTVDVHIRRLRKKLGSAGKHIQTLRGVGYKFKP